MVNFLLGIIVGVVLILSVDRIRKYFLKKDTGKFEEPK
jgi:hypothetical protein